MHDLRYGLRARRKQPLGNRILVPTMALLIGSASVLTASVREKRLHHAPFPALKTMVQVGWVGERGPRVVFPPALFPAYQDKTGAFQRLGGVRNRGRMTLTGIEEPVSYLALGVTVDVLSITGLTPLRGRVFDVQEHADAGDRIVLISEQLWREKPGAVPNVVGRVLDRAPCEGGTFRIETSHG